MQARVSPKSYQIALREVEVRKPKSWRYLLVGKFLVIS